ncbi:MAG: hypothetical protein Q4E71_07620, partial [Prevotella sp.]|nr:hypothetical protein [Prevotella sp.]
WDYSGHFLNINGRICLLGAVSFGAGGTALICVFCGDMGSALQYPLSFAIITGMTVGTMVSLFFVPLMYYLIYRRR